MKIAVIIGAGPAGLAAAYELINKSDIQPIIIERDSQVGGISKTLIHNGNRFDIGPHRFFSKIKRVNDLWQEILPLTNKNIGDDKKLLTVKRMTRILFLKKFFDYPINLNIATLKNLGLTRIFRIFISYLKIRLFPIKNEKSLEDFFINRFGSELYLTFFKDYTEKVWGVPCSTIPRDWGVQRVKDLSIIKAILNFIKNTLNFHQTSNTSLIEEFFYPVLGAGQMYEEMAKKIISGGGKIFLNSEIINVIDDTHQIKSVIIKEITGATRELSADYFISSMPVKDLINQMNCPSHEIKTIANGLVYRDYIFIGLLFKKMIKPNQTEIITKNKIIPDNWIYIQERDVKIGRLDIFNNFSSRMLKDDNLVWLGAEYFCNEGDDFWIKNDYELKDFAIQELEKINMTAPEDLVDYTIVRLPKAYPAYFGTYNQFEKIQKFTNNYKNLFLIGRNGTHRYNNMDHSILSGLTAADNIVNNITDKRNLWEINTENEYHEAK